MSSCTNKVAAECILSKESCTTKCFDLHLYIHILLTFQIIYTPKSMINKTNYSLIYLYNSEEHSGQNQDP